MKTTLLILLIILSLNCYSQITKCEKEMIRKVFTELVNEYKSDCYNDSIQVSYIMNGTTKQLPSWYIDFNTKESYEIPLYKHRKPTFEGFIEWLNRDYFIRNDSIIFLKNGNYKIEGRIGGKFTIEFEY